MATTCSYQNILRYESDRSISSRSRTLDDIRAEARRSAFKTRLQLKCIQMLRHRQTLTQLLINSNAEDDDHDELIGDTPATSECDTTTYGDDWCNDDTIRASTSSPSSTSEASYVELIDGYPVPAFFFETPCSSNGESSTSNRSTPNSARSVKQQHIYKANGHCNRTSASQRPLRQPPNPDQIKTDLLKMQQTFGEGRFDLCSASNTICLGWQTFADALQSSDAELVNCAINMLSTLYMENLINTDATLHILQRGLIFRLYEGLKYVQDGATGVIYLINNIIQSCPPVLPYLIENMKQSHMLDDFTEYVLYGNLEVVQPILQFYHSIIDLLMAHTMSDDASKQIQFQVPDILKMTGTMADTLEAYSPMATMIKIVQPSLILNIISRCLDRTMHREQGIVNSGLLVLADALKLATLKSRIQPAESEWIVEMLCCFRDSPLEQRIHDLTRHLNRVIRNSSASEHSSQGVGVDAIASNINELCQHFLKFYQSFYSRLAAIYADKMENTEAITHVYAAWM